MLKVTAGKEKNGIRKLKIGDDREKEVSRITTIFNTAYPVGGPTALTDNGFREGVSVTINGWYKDMPSHLWDISNEINVSFTDFFTGRDQVFSAPLDSIGRFSLKFPVQNSTSVFIDWRRSNLSLPVEPQCTYYLLNDFSTGQMMWMGEKSRLLNEFEEIKSELDSIRNEIDMVVDPSAEFAAMPDDIVEKGRNLLMRISDYNIDHGSPGFGREQADLQVQSLMLESMHSSPIVRDLCTAAFFTNIIDYKRESLPTVLEDSVDSVISHPSVRNAGHLSSMSMQIHVMAVSFL